jgi:glycosyltransferase involved in cell wall biosynthesis
MDVSVILATYRRPETLRRTLESFVGLDTTGFSWELIVVDNAADPRTAEEVKRLADRLPIGFLVEERRGKNHALNRALRTATGGLFVFTDDDVVADRAWIREMFEGAGRWPEQSVFGGRILPLLPPGKLPIPSDHKFFKFAYVIADWDLCEGPYDANDVWGPNMAIRSSMFASGWQFNTEVGPSGTNYVMGSETELTTRLEKAGFRSVYLPKSLVFHQIRPEQLRLDWVYGRAFRTGRYLAAKSDLPAAPAIRSIPVPLLKQILRLSVKRVLSVFDKPKAIEFGLRYWVTRGKIYEYRIKRHSLLRNSR